MKPIRSMMFVPGNKPSMIEKAAKAKADALILDLEDSVPPAERLKARELIVSRLSRLAEQRQRIYVRIRMRSRPKLGKARPHLSSGCVASHPPNRPAAATSQIFG